MSHHFADGVYTRTLKAKAGAVMLGKVHKTENCFCVVKGVVTVWDAENGLRELRAGYMEIGSIGIQRIAYAREDSVIKNVFVTAPENVEDAEKILAEPFDASGWTIGKMKKLLGA